MTEPVAFLDDRLVPLSEAKLSIFDLGLVQGASVTEMTRTFRHQVFHLDEHLDRLFRSIRYVGFDFCVSEPDVRAIVQQVVDHNAKLIPDSSDLGIIAFVTAGLNPTYVGAAGAENAGRPTFCVHTFPLPFELWAEKSKTGQHLVVPSVRHIPADSIDPRIKTRSRLHWYLADREARRTDPKAGCLLLDHNGNITETSTGNFFIVSDGVIRTPCGPAALGGITQQVSLQLATQMNIRCETADLRPYDVLNADEAFTSSTPYCLLPVTRFNGEAIGTGKPGPVYQRLVTAWSNLTKVDILRQIQSSLRD